MRSGMKVIYSAILVVGLLFFLSAAGHGDESKDRSLETSPPAIAEIKLSPEEAAWLARDHEVRVRVGAFPPFMFTDGEIRGIAVDYLETVFKRHNIRHAYVRDSEVSWKEALRYIKERKVVDMVPTAKITEARQRDMRFTDEYLFLPWVIFTRTDSPFVGGVDDLNEKTVSVPDGYVMHKLLEKEYPEIKLAVVKGTNTPEQCLHMLASGLVDAYIGNLAVGTHILQKKGFTNVKVAAPTPFGTHDQAMAVRKDWRPLVSIINKTLASLTPEEHARIKGRWLAVRYEHGISPLDIIKWGLCGLLLSGAVFSVIMGWNRRLNREIQERKRVEAELRDSEGKFRSLSEAAFEGIVISEKGIVIEANNTLRRMMGYDASELPGMEVTELLSPGEREGAWDRIRRGDETLYETWGLKKDGAVIPLEVQAKMFPYGGRNVRFTAIRDISERKKSEEEIRMLRGILPLCSFCKKIRDDKGYWEQVDIYIGKRSDVEISHSVCPDCMKEHYPEAYESMREDDSEKDR